MNSLAPSTRDPLEAGIAHHRAGDIVRAEASYKRALAARPGDPAALHLLGLAAFDKGRPERALQLIDKALARAPGQPDYLHSAGHVLQGMGRLDDAITRYREALAADPARVLTLSNLGNALKRAGRFDEAATALTRAVELAPDFAEGWSNLGLVEKERGDVTSALDCFARAAALRPKAPAFLFNSANTLAAAGQREEAAAAYRATLALDPGHAGAATGLGAMLRQMGRLKDARTALNDVLAHHPGHDEARWNLALAACMAGDWKEGFDAFEARRALPGLCVTPGRAGLEKEDAEWDGRPIPGRRLLIQHEQGIGDAIQYLRFAAEAAKLGARVTYRGPAHLLPLALRIDGITAAVPLDQPAPRYDVWVPMMSLPRLLRAVTPQKLSRSGYLMPEAARMARWRARLAGIGGCRVGINWQGNPAYGADSDRSIPLALFEPLAALPGVTLIALQQGAGREQMAEWAGERPLLDLAPELDTDGAFIDTAAVLPALDLVISSDTALAHLAGAVGIPAFLALAHVPDWRWGLEGTRPVWYPTVHVFRQRHPGDWTGVFEDMTEALGARIGVHG